MSPWIKIAFRGLLKNRRRSLFTTLAVGLSFTAVCVFGGFSNYIYQSLRDAYVYGQANGHLTVFKRGFLSKGKLDPASYLLTSVEVQRITELLERYSETLVVTNRLDISGLLSNGDVSVIFIGVGRVPSDVSKIRSHGRSTVARYRQTVGRPLDDSTDYGVALSSGLAEVLGLEIGDEAIAMSPTVSGQVNALDVRVLQLFDAAVEVLNDKLMFVPLSFAQSLYETTGADRVIVLLKPETQTLAMRAELKQRFRHEGLDVDVRTWKDLSPFYQRVKDMLDVIFLFLFVIVFTIAVMSVINTFSMAVMERTREIGTLRALGAKRRDIVKLFAVESAMIGFFGAVLGTVFTFLVWGIVKWTQPMWKPPIFAARVPIEVHLVVEHLAASMICLVLLGLLAGAIPARRAARRGIVDTLRHV